MTDRLIEQVFEEVERLPAQQGIAQVEGSQHNVQPTNPQLLGGWKQCG
jgi:hypothetical protein